MHGRKGILKLSFGIILALSLLLLLPKDSKAAVSYVPLSTNNTWVSGQISSSGETDFYSVKINKAGWLTIDYQGLSVEDSYIEIYNYDLTKEYCRTNVYNSSDTAPKNHTDVLALEPGTYALKIYGYGKNVGGYRVRASFKAANNNESSNNDTFATAQNLNLNQTVTGFLSEDDALDFYKVELKSRKTIRFIYTSYIRDSYFQIWDKDYIETFKQNVYSASEENPKTYVYEETLPAGTYYIKIYPYGSNTGRYTLKYEGKVLTQKILVSGNKVVTAGKSFKLNASVWPGNTTDKELEFSSGDTGIATVDSKTGRVRTYRAGRVNITISAKDGSNKTKVVSVIVRPKKMSRPFGYKKSKRKAYIYWSSVSGASGYQIQYSKNKSFKKAKKRRITKRSYVTISKLARKKYYVRVRAYVKSKKKYYYGAWSNRKIINMRKN